MITIKGCSPFWNAKLAKLCVSCDCLSAKTVCKYHTAAVTYGQQQLALECIDWLEKNLMTSQTVELLRDIR